MNLTFHKGTTVILKRGTDWYEFLVSEASASQTSIEANHEVKTLHNLELFKNTFVVGKSVANFNFTFYVESSGSITGALLNWGGYTNTGSLYNLVTTASQIVAEEIYIKSLGTTYKISSAVCREIQIKLDYRGMLQITVAGEGSLLEASNEDFTSGTMYSQKSYRGEIFNSSLVVNGYNNINAITYTHTKTLTWVKQNDLFQPIYYPGQPNIVSMGIGGSITQYKKDNILADGANVNINIQYGNVIINLPSCNTTERWDLQDIHKKVVDYKVLPTYGASQPSIQF